MRSHIKAKKWTMKKNRDKHLLLPYMSIIVNQSCTFTTKTKADEQQQILGFQS